MFPDTEGRDRGRGQAGIGTLVVFIAMVLVAAIATGVLINTSGFLHSTPDGAGHGSGDSATDGLQVVSKTGNVNGAGTAVQVVNVTVTSGPGAENVNLENVTASWIDAERSYELVEGTVSGSGADATFATTVLEDADGSAPVLNDPDDRVTLSFDLGSNTIGGSGSAFTDELGAGERVRLNLTTQSGATTAVRLVVPETLSGTSAVGL